MRSVLVLCAAAAAADLVGEAKEYFDRYKAELTTEGKYVAEGDFPLRSSARYTHSIDNVHSPSEQKYKDRTGTLVVETSRSHGGKGKYDGEDGFLVMARSVEAAQSSLEGHSRFFRSVIAIADVPVSERTDPESAVFWHDTRMDEAAPIAEIAGKSATTISHMDLTGAVWRMHHDMDHSESEQSCILRVKDGIIDDPQSETKLEYVVRTRPSTLGHMWVRDRYGEFVELKHAEPVGVRKTKGSRAPLPAGDVNIQQRLTKNVSAERGAQHAGLVVKGFDHERLEVDCDVRPLEVAYTVCWTMGNTCIGAYGVTKPEVFTKGILETQNKSWRATEL